MAWRLLIDTAAMAPIGRFIWNAGMVAVCVRSGKLSRTPVRIEHASLAIIGGMVPDRLREVLAGADDGLPRTLVCLFGPSRYRSGRYRERGATDAAEHRIAL